MKRERDPTPEEFEKFLGWLDADRDVAGEKYLALRKRLAKIFVVRGCSDPDRLVDEVMNRVAVRIDEVVHKYDSPVKCLLGFADNVYLEYWRDLKPDQLDDNRVKPIAPDPTDQEQSEIEDDCLSKCLAELPTDDAYLFRRYFQEDDSRKMRIRKSLADKLGLTPNALRIKAHRIRKRLRKCMENCLGKATAGEMNYA